MKLRIKGDSLRLRISPSEMERLLSTGRVEETIHFAPAPGAHLTYVLQTVPLQQETTVRYQPQQVTVVLSLENARDWAEGAQVGIYGAVDVGCGQLTLAIEKDFACLDRREGSEDTFANPKSAQAC